MTGFVPNWAATISAVNVLDYGADPTGATDSTAAIQAAIDAAWGPISQPNGTDIGVGSADKNKVVYIPNGYYNVTAPPVLTITNVTWNAATTSRRVTVSGSLSASGYVNGKYVFVDNVVGSDSGTTNAFAIASNVPSGINVINDTTFDCLNSSDFGTAIGSATYTSGGTVSGAALNVTSVMGGMLIGAGRFATKINSTGACISFNGFGYGKIENIEFVSPTAMSSGPFCCFNLNWDQTAVPGWHPNTMQSAQSVTIHNCSFGGGKHVIIHGWGGAMTSETLFLNNNINSSGAAANVNGIYVANGNSCGVSIIGGNIANNTVGIEVGSGAIEVIHGVHFQANSAQDIYIHAGQGDGCSVVGCRSESDWFCFFQSGLGVSVVSCNQTQGTSGTFVRYDASSDLTQNPGLCSIINCFSKAGILGGNGFFSLTGTRFAVGYATAIAGLNALTGGIITNLDVEPQAIADLPVANAHVKGLRMKVKDANTAASTSNFSATVGVAGALKTISDGGTNILPVWCDGTDWRVG